MLAEPAHLGREAVFDASTGDLKPTGAGDLPWQGAFQAAHTFLRCVYRSVCCPCCLRTLATTGWWWLPFGATSLAAAPPRLTPLVSCCHCCRRGTITETDLTHSKWHFKYKAGAAGGLMHQPDLHPRFEDDGTFHLDRLVSAVHTARRAALHSPSVLTVYGRSFAIRVCSRCACVRVCVCECVPSRARACL